ncbi:DUF6522 family protein [Hephaestia sp. GCM10023244]|uniref:DUF6522 family protein n=1 Tax=unclassified Hephaestia TaxID=2631281 RepID=UPI002076F0B6|nr:DUF6522 family protein [Hephaestia sp. MAHUQ-44]MCM8730360.1 DUF6522 family protein [Hephaestia sp. MAHUQ-44]
MTRIRFDDGGIEVDAAIIAEGLRIAPEHVPAEMQAGQITARCERGIDEHAGTHRLSFFRGNRRFRVTVDDAGNVLRRSTLTTADPPADTVAPPPPSSRPIGQQGSPYEPA